MDAISSALSGIGAAESRLNAAAVQLSGGSAGEDGTAGVDSVDFSSAMIALLQARTGVQASVKIAQVVQETDKSLFSLLG